MEPIVGIDLGTTNSEVAFVLDSRAQVLKDLDDGIVPSCVGLDRNGKLMVGAEARNQAVVAPERTVSSVKRLMGSDEPLALGDKLYRPQEISALILKTLKARAEKILGQPIGKAVITVPAYFTDAQRHATREAGEIAGLEVIRIINEPTAAALAYESSHSEARQILIFDLGGGTFDVSIVRMESGVVEVLASTGDNHLGGDDFDQKITDLLVEHCNKELKLSVQQDPAVMARLKRAAETAKIRLSTEPYVVIEEDHIGRRRGKDLHLSRELSRLDLEQMIEDDLGRTMEAVSKALNDAGLLPANIDKIILVGGSTRIPAISTMLEEKFGQLPHSEIDPDLCVALGAAIQAGREMGLDQSGVLIDITPYTFGTSAVGEIDGVLSWSQFVPIIRRNTKLPATRTEAFATIVDGQEGAEIKVYQGEEPDALDNIRIGTYHFDLTRAPHGSVILLQYSLDLNGILQLEAVEKDTGRKITAVIENAFSQTSEAELSESKQRIADVWIEDVNEPGSEHSGAVSDVAMPLKVQELVKRAEAVLPEAPEEDRDELVDLLEDIRDAVDAGDSGQLEEAREALEDLLFYLEDA